MAEWMQSFHMKPFETFSGLVTQVDSLTQKIIRNFKMVTAEQSIGPF